MKKFIITESEKERILNMHRNAIKRQYLKEQEEVDTSTANAQKTLSMIPDLKEFKQILITANKNQDTSNKFYMGKKHVLTAQYISDEGGDWNVQAKGFAYRKYGDGKTYIDFTDPERNEPMPIIFRGVASTSVTNTFYAISDQGWTNDGVLRESVPSEVSTPVEIAKEITKNMGRMGGNEMQNLIAQYPKLVAYIKQLKPSIPEVIKNLGGGASLVYKNAGITVDIEDFNKKAEEERANIQKNQAAAAEADAKKAAEDDKAAADKKAAIDAQNKRTQDAIAMTEKTKREWYDNYLNKLANYESMTQEDVEALITQVNEWSKINYKYLDTKAFANTVGRLNKSLKVKFPAITNTLNSTFY